MPLTDVPEMISIHNKVYNSQYIEFFVGYVFMTTDNEPFYSLTGALNKLVLHSQLNCQYCLFTIDNNTVVYSCYIQDFRRKF